MNVNEIKIKGSSNYSKNIPLKRVKPINMEKKQIIQTKENNNSNLNQDKIHLKNKKIIKEETDNKYNIKTEPKKKLSSEKEAHVLLEEESKIKSQKTKIKDRTKEKAKLGMEYKTRLKKMEKFFIEQGNLSYFKLRNNFKNRAEFRIKK